MQEARGEDMIYGAFADEEVLGNLLSTIMCVYPLNRTKYLLKPTS